LIYNTLLNIQGRWQFYKEVAKDMQKLKHKKIILIIAITTVLAISEYIGHLPYIAARISSSIYIAINYPSKGFKFESAEYAYGFGDYFVRYKDKEGNDAGLMLFPKEFPIFIRYDSIKGEG
jgi:hypothetical protein